MANTGNNKVIKSSQAISHVKMKVVFNIMEIVSMSIVRGLMWYDATVLCLYTNNVLGTQCPCLSMWAAESKMCTYITDHINPWQWRHSLQNAE
jgi:hypothetical protein